MAFVSFLNFILIGKMIGPCKAWGLKLKNIGLWYCIALAVQTFFSVSLSFGLYIDLFVSAMSSVGVETKINFAGKFFEIWYIITGGTYFKSAIPSNDITTIYNVANVITTILDLALWLATAFFEIHLLLLLFRKISPQNATLLTILCIFVPEALGIILFVMRNKDFIDYDEYIRNRARQYTYYYNQTYNPNSTYTSGFNSSYSNGANTNNTANGTKNDDPFPEFSNNGNSSTDNPYGTEGFGKDN